MRARQCSEEAALYLALCMTSLGWIHSVTHEHYLRNEFILYQFEEKLFHSTTATARVSKCSSSEKTIPISPCLDASDDRTCRVKDGAVLRDRSLNTSSERAQSVVECLQARLEEDKLHIRALEEVCTVLCCNTLCVMLATYSLTIHWGCMCVCVDMYQMKLDLADALKDVSQQATTEITTLRAKVCVVQYFRMTLMCGSEWETSRVLQLFRCYCR